MSGPVVRSTWAPVGIYMFTRNFALASLAQIPSALRAGFTLEAKLCRMKHLLDYILAGEDLELCGIYGMTRSRDTCQKTWSPMKVSFTKARV